MRNLNKKLTQKLFHISSYQSPSDKISAYMYMNLWKYSYRIPTPHSPWQTPLFFEKAGKVSLLVGFEPTSPSFRDQCPNHIEKYDERLLNASVRLDIVFANAGSTVASGGLDLTELCSTRECRGQQKTHPPNSPSLLPTVRRIAFDCCGLQLFTVAFSRGTEFTL